MEETQPELEGRVLDFIRHHRLTTRGEGLVVGVSGGADSVCLLHILARLKKRLGIRLHAAHLNHGLRGREAAADAEYTACLAHRLGIPFIPGAADVGAYRAQRRTSLEEAAREVRYDFLAGVAGAVGAGKVAVGHTGDDHIETVLMHLIRGSGTRGLGGLRPISSWPTGAAGTAVIRPLLDVSRRETQAYCREQALAPRSDTSNLSLSPLRNRIRLELLPLLEGYNPGIAQALLRTAAIAGDDAALIDSQVKRLWPRLTRQEGNTIFLDRKGTGQLPIVLRRYLLRAVIESLLGNTRDIEMRHIAEIMSIMAGGAGKSLSLPHGLTFHTEYDRYVLTLDPAAPSPFPAISGEYPLAIPGTTLIPGWRVEATIVNSAEMAAEDSYVAYLDLDKTGSESLVRPRREGDRFQPLGLGQPKKLGAFMIDARIPRLWRRHIPLVCSPRQVLWVVGWRIDERVKVTAGTRRVLRLRFERR